MMLPSGGSCQKDRIYPSKESRAERHLENHSETFPRAKSRTESVYTTDSML